MTRLTAHFMYGLMSVLVICKFRNVMLKRREKGCVFTTFYKDTVYAHQFKRALFTTEHANIMGRTKKYAMVSPRQ